MRHLLVRASIVLGFIPGLVLGPAAPAAAAEASSIPKSAQSPSPLTSPAEFLNPDGTLRLDGEFSGALDLSGWTVYADPEKGPVLAPLSTAAPGEWSDLSYGAGDLNGTVYAMAMYGGELIVGGDFQDAGHVSQADRIAAWDGSNWHGLGDNGYGNGPIQSSVLSLLVSGSDLYIGGWFYYITQDGVYNGAADYIARWDGTDWYSVGSNGAGNGSLNSAVYAIAMVGTDLYAGGSFTNVVDVTAGTLTAADYIARWDTVGEAWSAVGDDGAGTPNGSLSDTVYALAAMGTDLYVGGNFINVKNGVSTLGAADYVALWDTVGASWSALGGDGALTPNGSLSSFVRSLASIGSDLYVGGAFANVKNGVTTLGAADYIARWDTLGSSWSALSDNGGGGGSINSWVTAITAVGTDLYIGGYMLNVNNGGTTLPEADYIALWDTVAEEWSEVGANAPGQGALVSAVLAVLVDGSTVFAGGDSQGVNNDGTFLTHARHLAAWDGVNWEAVGAIQGPFEQPISAVTVVGTDVYVGGYFFDLPNHGVPVLQADHIARWDGSNWHGVGDSGYSDGPLNGQVTAITVDGADIIAGGYFYGIVDDTNYLPEAAYIAKFHNGHWSALGSDGSSGPSLNNGVAAIAVNGSEIYVAGGFVDVKDAVFGTLGAADYIAMWNGSNWSALGDDGGGGGSFPQNSDIQALVFMGGDLYVGGYFTNVKNGLTPLNAADFIARWDGFDWSAVSDDGLGNGPLNSPVLALAASGSDLYVGGGFYNVDNHGAAVPAADFIARWDGSDWHALGDNGSGEAVLNSDVESIVIRGSDVYVGGWFNDIYDAGALVDAADYVARFSGGHWYGLGEDGAGGGSIKAGDGYAYVGELAVSATDLYVGGYFFDVVDRGTTLPHADYMAAYGLSPNALADFDADGDTDVSVFRTGTWFVRNQGATGWGQAGDIPIAADYDGDSDSDFAVYRPSTGGWRVKDQFVVAYGGAVGDVPVPADYDGDGDAGPAIFRPSTAGWYIKDLVVVGYGLPTDIPVPGDYDGNGVTDIAVFRDGTWFIKDQGVIGYGQVGDIPIPGDYNGDGTTDIAVYRPSTGGWRVRNQFIVAHGGLAGDIPVPGDYDADGDTDVAIYRSSTAGWYIKDQFTVGYGLPTDYPVPARDTNGDGDPYQ